MWKKMRQKYYDCTLAGKVMLAFSLFLVVFCTVSQAVLQFCLAVYDEKLYEKSLQELDYFTQEVNRSLEEVRQLSAEAAMDDDIQEQLVKLQAAGDSDAVYSLGLLKLRELLTIKVNENRNVKSAGYYDGRKADMVIGVSAQRLPESVKEEMAEPMEAARGGCVDRDPDETWGYYVAGRNILEKEHARLTYLGTLVLNCDVAGIISRNVRNLEAEHASLYVYNDRFTIYQDEAVEGLALPACQEGKGYRIARVGRERYFVCYLYSRATGWMYANVFPYTEIYGQIWFVRMLLIGATVILAVLFAAGMRRLIKTITHPLHELTRSMQVVETGDFEGARKFLTLDSRRDETGQLQREFDTMLTRINELIRENYEKQLLLKDTSYRMLRAQINPHFIYNTLNTINWMVKWKKNEEVGRLIMQFGNLLRSAFAEDPFATVEEELASVEGYMAVQAYRYKGRGEFQVEKSGDLGRYRTPRMILQPLVENSICHGIEESLETCTVRVCVRETEDSIVYEVSDTGPGMDAATLQAVRDGTVKPRGNGIGLANIRERLRLLFEESIFTVDSAPGSGTTIRICIPKTPVEGGQDDGTDREAAGQEAGKAEEGETGAEMGKSGAGKPGTEEGN